MNSLIGKRVGQFSGIALCAALITPIVAGQTPAQPAPEPQPKMIIDSSRIAGEIDDRACGSRWLLLRDEHHRGGPGQLVQLNSNGSHPAFELRFNLPHSAMVPVIRAGDSLILEEHTKIVDARFEALALGPAQAGASFRARLKLGGRIVRAVATGPGKATLPSDREPRP